MRLERRMHPPGTSPGTIVVPARAEVPPRAILTRFTATEIEEIEVDRPDIFAQEPKPGQLAWLDVEGHDEALISELARRFEIPALVLEDIVNLGQRPKVEEYDGCVFVVADLVCRNPQSRHVTIEQISLVLQENLLVSFKVRPSDVFEPIRLRLRSGKGRMRVGGLDYLAYALLDAVVDHCFPVLEEIGGRLEEIEEKMDLKPSPELLAELHRVRRDLVHDPADRLAAARDGQPAAARRGRPGPGGDPGVPARRGRPRVDDRRHGRDLPRDGGRPDRALPDRTSPTA